MKKIIILSLMFSSIGYAKISKKEVELCTPSKEYITTMNFLISKKEFSLKRKDAMSVASDVAKGCSGSAKSFIHTLNLLTKMELTTADAINISKKVAIADRDRAWAFRDILKNSFAESKLNLSLSDSVTYALKLSIEYQGDANIARIDFENLVEFCKSSENLDLPAHQCAKMAFNISKLTGKFNKELSPSFIDLFNYMVESEGPAMTTMTALEMAENLMSYGPNAKNNFKLAYRFAISKNGLNVDRVKAIKFARNLAKQSYREIAQSN